MLFPSFDSNRCFAKSSIFLGASIGTGSSYQEEIPQEGRKGVLYLSDVAFASAPTTCRISAKTVIMVAKSFDLTVGSFDVTPAFFPIGYIGFCR